jgi:hypothetical protein
MIGRGAVTQKESRTPARGMRLEPVSKMLWRPEAPISSYEYSTETVKVPS